jgi:tetratricopeptide (TPR) repeat protein
MARSSRRGSNDRERRGIINDDTKREREQKKREEEKKREAERREEEKRKKEEKKRAAAEKKKQLEEKRKQALAAAKKAQEEQRKARLVKAKAAKSGDREKAKGGDKDASFKEAEAEKMVAAAEEAFASGTIDDLLKGVELLRHVSNELGGTAAAGVAAKRLDQLLNHPIVGPAALVAEGDQYFGAARYRQALNKYNELLAKFPESEQAAHAGERVAEIRENDLLSKTVYTEEELEDARLWFLAGTIHLENGRETEARGSWRRVVELYPGSPYAKRAESKLQGEPQT